MKKISFEKLIPDRKVARFLLATLVSTIGVYLAYPVHGFVSTLPLSFFFSILAFLISGNLSVHLITAGAIAFFYGLMTAFYSPVFFAIFALLIALTAALAVKRLQKSTKAKAIIFLVFFGIATILTFIFSGTPSGFLAAKAEAKDYLAKTYPEQSFEEVTVYYNLERTCYAAEVTYLYEGNDLTSTIYFDRETEDGFLTDYSLWLQDKRRSIMIDVLKKADANVLIESKGLSEKTKDGVFHGSYGVVSSEMEPLFHFSVTFREEQPKREEFADACRGLLATLNEAKFDFGTVTFYALDAGNVVYECTVFPETDPETVLSLVKYAS